MGRAGVDGMGVVSQLGIGWVGRYRSIIQTISIQQIHVGVIKSLIER